MRARRGHATRASSSRSAAPKSRCATQLRELALILVLGLPLAIAVAGLGGYVLARRALAPIERMTEHARTITAERLGDRLPVDNPEDEMGRLAAVFNETLGPPGGVVRADAPVHRRRLA